MSNENTPVSPVVVVVIHSTAAAALVCAESHVAAAGGLDNISEGCPRAWVPKKHLVIQSQEMGLTFGGIVKGAKGLLEAAYLQEEETKFVQHSKKHAVSHGINAELVDITEAIEVGQNTESVYAINCMGLLESLPAGTEGAEGDLNNLMEYPQIVLIPRNVCRLESTRVMAPLWCLTSSVERIHLKSRSAGLNLVQINIAGLAFPVTNTTSHDES